MSRHLRVRILNRRKINNINYRSVVEIRGKKERKFLGRRGGFGGKFTGGISRCFRSTSVPRLCMPSGYTPRYVHTRHGVVRSFFPNRVYIYAREAMQQRHGRHLPKRERLFLGCMRSLPAPSPLLKYLTKHFSGKLPLSLSLSLPSKISHRTRESFLIHGRSAVARKMPLNLTSFGESLAPFLFFSFLFST